jgi:Thiamine pyrophosphate enzyme, N-terminal TPP binding domain
MEIANSRQKFWRVRKCLPEVAGVKHCWGVPGDTLNYVTDAIRRSEIEWVHVRHEEVGGFAAGAEALLSGNLTACAGSCGPGSLHFINGLFESHRNRAPVVLIASQVTSDEQGFDFPQEVDFTPIYRTCSVFCSEIRSPGRNIYRLARLSNSFRRGFEARSEPHHRSTLLSRGDDKTTTRIVVVMQRVHQTDLVGHLQEQGGFDVLNLPAIAQRPQTYDLGGGRTYTRQYGELLHPEHEPAHVLIELKREMGPIAFSAQYQQTPIPPGGTIIKRKWLPTYDEIGSRPDDRIVMSWAVAGRFKASKPPCSCR